ncbi:hypothetical protein PPYR_00919 [Photinus pyralis]|uniref:Peptidase M13 N-terminal domain-containing protein n=1 Tax=Photinus pyralis TaxID=7054 RepID=A0A5N4B2W6_PHOPY|nr:neprilysin-2-like [Photinus pyralis]KAB0803949.1 hypothetical protein PPYR_00919 [Photinus pyralis]
MDDITSELLNSKRKKLKKWWEQLSHLEQNLIISLVIIGTVLLFIILVLIIRGATSSKICTTRHCLLAASEIATLTDPTIDPCHDFYQFTCRKLSELDNKKVQITAEQIEDKLIDILLAPNNGDEGDQLMEHKQLFGMCLNQSVGEESFREINAIMGDLHGWPVALGYEWKAGSFEWKNMIKELRSKGLPYNMLLSISVAPSPTDQTFMLHIQKPEVAKIPQQYRYDYRKFMQEVAIAFGAERSRALNDMKRVLDFIIEMGKLTDKSKKYEKHRLIDIQRYFGEVDWVNFLNDILQPSASVTIDDYVITPGHKYLHEFFTLLNRTPKRIQANYILWVVVEQYLPFLSERLRVLQSNYAHLTGSVKLSPERWHLQQCYSIASSAFVSPPAEILFLKRHQREGKANGIVQLAQNVRKAFVIFLKETRWITNDSKLKILSKLEDLAIMEASLNEEDDKTPSTEGGFLHRYLIHIRDRINFEYKRMLDETKQAHYHPLYTLEVTYLQETNTLVLPIGSYFADVPFYLNYGELGSIISHTLTHAMLANEDEQPWTANYNESSKCVKHQNTDPVDLIGIQLAYAAYQIWVYNHDDEDQLIGLQHTPNQLAWIASALGYCSLIRDQSTINTITKNHPNFHRDFECPWGSPMNPLQKCTLI